MFLLSVLPFIHTSMRDTLLCFHCSGKVFTVFDSGSQMEGAAIYLGEVTCLLLCEAVNFHTLGDAPGHFLPGPLELSSLSLDV